ncbi:MAG TPA: TonB-dependent receptor, partial [Steroidobacteraceae bacterium]|nr:TonB-dependent receptor [Steroidobacteraceae bacterium]
GREWDNWFPNWSDAVAAAEACNDPAQSSGIVCDDAYWNASGLRQEDLGYLALDLPLGEAWRLTTTAYLHKDEGQGLWGTPYVPTPGGAPLSIRTTEYDLDRQGVIASLTWRGEAHEISAGAWYETNDFTQARRFYAEPSSAAPSRSFEDMQRNPFRTDWEYDFETETVTFYLQERWTLTDGLRLDVGFRSVNVENRATTIVGDVKSGAIEADEPFLPQVGVNWRLGEEMEAFASVARNVRAFASSGTSGPFSTNAAAFNAIRDSLEPETSTNYEAGLRFRGRSLDGVVTAYHVDFDDRLLGIPQCLGIVGCAGALANVGSVRTNGIEAALAWRALDHVSWFNSLAWNDSEFADDYTITDAQGTRTVVPVSGKQVPDAPEILFKSELSYDNGSLFAHFDLNYTDERFYTYLNEGGVGAYTLLNVGVGYRFKGVLAVEELLLQADVTNLTDEEYFSTIDSNGFVNSDLDRNEQTLLLGAPRQFFVSLKARF